MILANRPWRLVGDLSKVIAAALATGAFLVVDANVWSIADRLGALLLGLLSVAALAGWLVFAHELWERPEQVAGRQQVRRANAATVLTLLLMGYLMLFVLVLFATALVIPDSYCNRSSATRRALATT